MIILRIAYWNKTISTPEFRKTKDCHFNLKNDKHLSMYKIKIKKKNWLRDGCVYV